MPIFHFQLRYDFNPGHVNGGTEERPKDLLDEDGSPFSLGVWPDVPLRIEAPDERRAFELAQGKRQQDPSIFTNTRIGAARFDELRSRPRPGFPESRSSILEIWTVRAEGQTEVHMVSLAEALLPAATQ
jgi:hypothetical protein